MDNRFIDEALQQIRENLLKAAETTSTYTFSPTTRSIFSPENLDEKVKFLVPIDTPMRNRFPRVPGKGQSAENAPDSQRTRGNRNADCFCGRRGSQRDLPDLQFGERALQAFGQETGSGRTSLGILKRSRWSTRHAGRTRKSKNLRGHAWRRGSDHCRRYGQQCP